MIDPDELPIESEEPEEPAEPVEVVGTAPLAREEIVARCIERLVGEGQPPFTAELLANVYATTYELETTLAGFAQLGGLDGMLGGVFGKLLGRKGRRDGG